MKRLGDHGANTFSQFGEDGIIEFIFDAILVESKRCVEFGAADGLECSNTANLWMNHGWDAILIEADEERYRLLEENVDGRQNVTTLKAEVSHLSGHENSIDQIVGPDTPIDFMSIDIDGDDYWVWRNTDLEPRVVCIEFNQTIPPHLSMKQNPGDGKFGASALALIELGSKKGYAFIGRTHSNLFFVQNAYRHKFQGHETNIRNLMEFEEFGYVVTDYFGNSGFFPPQVLQFGANPPLVGVHGVRNPGIPLGVVGQAVAKKYGAPPVILTLDNWHNVDGQHPRAVNSLRDHLKRYDILLIAIDYCGEMRERWKWVVDEAESWGFSVYEDPGHSLLIVRNHD